MSSDIDAEKIYKSYPVADRKKLGRAGCLMAWSINALLTEERTLRKRIEELEYQVTKGQKLLKESKGDKPNHPGDPGYESIPKPRRCVDDPSMFLMFKNGSHVRVSEKSWTTDAKRITRVNELKKEIYESMLDEYREALKEWTTSHNELKDKYPLSKMKKELITTRNKLKDLSSKISRMKKAFDKGDYSAMAERVTKKGKKTLSNTPKNKKPTKEQMKAAMEHQKKVDEMTDEEKAEVLITAHEKIKKEETRAKKISREISRGRNKKQTRHRKELPARKDQAELDAANARAELERLRSKMNISAEEENALIQSEYRRRVK